MLFSEALPNAMLFSAVHEALGNNPTNSVVIPQSLVLREVYCFRPNFNVPMIRPKLVYLSPVISSQSFLIPAIPVTFRFVVTSFVSVFYLSELLFLKIFI